MVITLSIPSLEAPKAKNQRWLPQALLLHQVLLTKKLSEISEI